MLAVKSENSTHTASRDVSVIVGSRFAVPLPFPTLSCSFLLPATAAVTSPGCQKIMRIELPTLSCSFLLPATAAVTSPGCQKMMRMELLW